MVSRAHTNRQILWALLFTTWLVGTAIAADPQGGAKFFCCNDSAGKYVCGDTVPVACYGRAYRELGADGRTVREVEAPLTAEQRARKAAEEETARREAARQKEQQRKDQALMETYVNVEEIETMRKRALDDVRQSIRNTEAAAGCPERAGRYGPGNQVAGVGHRGQEKGDRRHSGQVRRRPQALSGLAAPPACQTSVSTGTSVWSG